MPDRTKSSAEQPKNRPSRAEAQVKAERQEHGAHAGDKPSPREVGGILRELAEQQRHLD
jgi:hypothetical protein